MALALQPSTKTLSPRPQAPDRPPQRTNQPSRDLQLALSRRRPPAAQQSKIRDYEGDDEISGAADPCGCRRVTVENHLQLVDRRQHEPDNQRDPDRTPQTLALKAIPARVHDRLSPAVLHTRTILQDPG